MLLELCDGLRKLSAVKATSVVVRDADSNPVAVIIERGKAVHMYAAGDPNFAEALLVVGACKPPEIIDMERK